MGPKILVLDIETAPKKAYIWSMWKQTTPIKRLIEDTYVLCWTAKWLGKKEIFKDAVWFHKKPEDDKEVLKSIHKLLEEADMVVAHNGDGFDVPTLNARFVIQGMKPPSPYKQVDTLKTARRKFRFSSNRLDALGRFLQVGRKLETNGDELWLDVLAGVKSAQRKMLAYNKQDVILLEKVYNKLRPWDNRHPSVSVYQGGDRPRCAVCGSTHVQKRGKYVTNARVYDRFKCVDCGHNMRGRYSSTKKGEAQHNLVSV